MGKIPKDVKKGDTVKIVVPTEAASVEVTATIQDVRRNTKCKRNPAHIVIYQYKTPRAVKP